MCGNVLVLFITSAFRLDSRWYSDYSAEVQKQVDSGINFEDVDVDLKLAVLNKPIHTTWLVELYNFFTSTEGKVYVLKGWEKAGIKDVFNGKEGLPPVDPYQDIYANN